MIQISPETQSPDIVCSCGDQGLSSKTRVAPAFIPSKKTLKYQGGKQCFFSRAKKTPKVSNTQTKFNIIILVFRQYNLLIWQNSGGYSFIVVIFIALRVSAAGVPVAAHGRVAVLRLHRLAPQRLCPRHPLALPFPSSVRFGFVLLSKNPPP